MDTGPKPGISIELQYNYVYSIVLLFQINSNYYSLTDSYCSDLTRLTLPGRQCELERIFPHAKEILYTDIHGNPFLHAGFDGHAYWRALHSTSDSLL